MRRNQIYTKLRMTNEKIFPISPSVCYWGSSALSAHFSVSPHDPAFLDSFNESQKKAIYNFLSQELGKPIAEGNGVVEEAELKELHKKLQTSAKQPDQNSPAFQVRKALDDFKTYANQRPRNTSSSASNTSSSAPVQSKSVASASPVTRKEACVAEFTKFGTAMKTMREELKLDIKPEDEKLFNPQTPKEAEKLYKFMSLKLHSDQTKKDDIQFVNLGKHYDGMCNKLCENLAIREKNGKVPVGNSARNEMYNIQTKFANLE